MRTINVEEITKSVKEACIEANHFLSKDVEERLRTAAKEEEAPLGRQILEQLEENLKIAGEDMIPICQDTDMAVIFMEIGQEGQRAEIFFAGLEPGRHIAADFFANPW